MPWPCTNGWLTFARPRHANPRRRVARPRLEEGPPMAGDPQVLGLLEEMLSSGKTPEEVCRHCPELLPRVRAGLLRVRLLEQELGALFPRSETPACVRPAPAPSELPRIPGYEVEGELGRGGMGVVYRA